MKEGWNLKPWKEVLQIKSGRNQKEVENPNGTYPILGSAGKVMGYADSFLCEGGTTIIGRKGTIDNPLYIETKFWNVDTAFGLIAGEELHPKYLFYFCLGFNFKNLDKGTTLPSLVKKDLEKILLPVPSIAEQFLVVTILDEAFAAIEQAKANIEKNIQNAKEVFQSKLNEIFSQKGEGWLEKTLIEIASEFGRGKSKHRPRNDKKLYGGDYPFVQTGDIRNAEKYVSTYTQTYNEVGLQQSKLWEEGTICITIAANIAETAILQIKGCFPDSIIGLVVNPELAEIDYTYYSLQFLKAELQKLGKGSAQDNINLGTFKDLKFPFPDLGTQRAIGEELDHLKAFVNRIIAVYDRKLLLLENLKKSILQKAFAGELTNKEVEA